MKISVIVRVLNEAGALDVLLTQLGKQDYPDFEVIIVDNESDDDSVKIAKKHGSKIVTLARNDFSYPTASNLGAKTATGDLLVYVSAHAELVYDDWLSSGAKWFDDQEVVGVYGGQFAMRDSPLAEKIRYDLWKVLGLSSDKPSVKRKSGMGVMGATNCMMRASYFKDNPYDESFGAGGEDEAWARSAIADNKKIIHEPKFTVRHSHRLGARQLISQHRYWGSLKKPAKFSRKRLQEYGRNDYSDSE